MPSDPGPERPFDSPRSLRAGRLFAVAFLLTASLHLPSPGWLLPLDLLLLTAAWLLAARLFASPLAVFFAAVAVAGSTLWTGATAGASPVRLLDFVLGLTPAPYCGLFTFAFAVLALVHTPPRPRAAALATIALAAAILLLRGAVLPWLRLGVIFLAGRGLDATLASGLRPLRLMTPTGAGFLALAALLLPLDAATGMACLGAFLTGGVFLLLGRARRTVPLGLALLLILHPLDVFSWKFRTTWPRTSPAPVSRVP